MAPQQDAPSQGDKAWPKCISDAALSTLITPGQAISDTLVNGLFKNTFYQTNGFSAFSDTLIILDSSVVCVIVNYSGDNCADGVLFTLNCQSQKLLTHRLVTNCDVDQDYIGEFSTMDYLMESSSRMRVTTRTFVGDSMLRASQQYVCVLPDGAIVVEN